MSTIQVPQEFIDQLNSAIDGDGIRLPFTAPVIWWKHGNKQLKNVGGVRYFGGWASNAEEFFAAIGEFGGSPHGFSDATYTGDNGDFAVYETRAVAVAPIATRKRWIVNAGSKGRSHLQMLCMLATRTVDGIFAKWGPVVLSAKGLATREIEHEMKAFDTFTLEARQQIAPGVPPLYFWRVIGTFGDAPDFSQAGSGNNTSTVTYPKVYQPSAVTVESIEKWFVGNDTAGEMVHYRNEAQEWLSDKQWKQGKDEADTDEIDPNFAGGYMNNDDLPF